MIEVVLSREDANTEFALLAEWLVADQGTVRRGQAICVVETSKASVEVEAPGDGTLVQLYEQGVEVELGREIALVAESAEELAGVLERRGRPKAREDVPTGRATRKAIALAAAHGIDLDSIQKDGFVTAEDVEALVRRGAEPLDPLLAGASTQGVTLPASFGTEDTAGVLDPAFLDSLRADPESLRRLPSDEKCQAYRDAGAAIGNDVRLEEGALVVAPRIVIADGVRLGPRASVVCEEVVAVGALTHFGPDLEIACRRAFIGDNVHGGRSIRVGGGGHRDPWAILAVGDLAFIGDEVFVNVCRPVLIGRRVFLTQRAMLVTHNIGHSILEGFENRFAPVVLEDMSQVGLGSVVYAGCRVGERAIVASASYVVSDVPPGKLAIGVPARAAGDVQRRLSRAQQVELAREMVEDLAELLALRGHPVSPIGQGLAGFELELERGPARVLFVERADGSVALPAGAVETLVLTLDYAGGEVPGATSVVDLLAEEIHGGAASALADAVREFCRKRGMRIGPGPWRYRGGLI